VPDQTHRFELRRRTGQHRAVRQASAPPSPGELPSGSWLMRASVLALAAAVLIAGIVLATRQWRHSTPAASTSGATQPER
jgi:hypothetical protein